MRVLNNAVRAHKKKIKRKPYYLFDNITTNKRQDEKSKER